MKSAVALVRAAAAAGCGLAIACSGAVPPPLPEPKLEAMSPPVRMQVRPAWTDASARPDDPDAVGALGRALYAYGGIEAAAECFERSRALDRKAFEWAYLLGVAYADLGRSAEAQAAFREAAALRPDDLPTTLRLADLLERSGDAAGARTLLEGALERSAAGAAVHFRLGRLTLAEAPAASVEHLERALAIEPDYREALYALANAYRAEGRAEDAEDRLAQYRRTEPNPRRHYADPLVDAMDEIRAQGVQQTFDDALALQARGDLSGALDLYRDVLEMDPGHAQAHVNLIAVHGDLGNPALAKQHYGRAVELNPSIAEAHYNYGVSLHYAGDHQGAADAFSAALAINPQNADAHGNLGTALDSLGRQAEALRHFRLALEHNPSHPMAHFYLGKRLADRGRYREALPHLEAAVRTETVATALHAFALALVHREMGQAGEALRFARMAADRARGQRHQDLLARIVAAFDL